MNTHITPTGDIAIIIPHTIAHYLLCAMQGLGFLCFLFIIIVVPVWLLGGV